MDQINAAHNHDAEAPKKLLCGRIVKIFIHRAKNIGLAEDSGLGDNDVVHIPYRYGEEGIESDDFGNVAQEGDVLVNAIFGQRVKLS